MSEPFYNPTSLSQKVGYLCRNLIYGRYGWFSKRYGNHRIGVVGMKPFKIRIIILGASVVIFRTDPLLENIDNECNGDIQNWSFRHHDRMGTVVVLCSKSALAIQSMFGTTIRRDGSSLWLSKIDGECSLLFRERGLYPMRSFSNHWTFSPLLLRAVGVMSNQEIGNYPYSSLIGVGQYIYSFGGNVVTGAQLQQMGNNKDQMGIKYAIRFWHRFQFIQWAISCHDWLL